MTRRTPRMTVFVCTAACIVLLLGLPGADAATLIINNLDGPGEGFKDPTPVAPVGGNPGTTLGQQRLNVFQRAADIWGSAIDSDVPIRIQATLDPLSCNASSAVLGSAGPIEVVRNFSNAPQSSTWYHIALANALAGVDLIATSDDISATFNSAIDNNNSCLSGISWYLGYDHNPSAGISLLVVLLHEFAHGLGFSGFVNLTTGRLLQNVPDVFSVSTYDNSLGLTWDQMSNGQRRSSATNTGNVVWNGVQVRAAADELLTAGQDGAGNVRLYAPSSVSSGSSIYHFDTVARPNLLMEPNINSSLDGHLDLSDELMVDIGWTLIDSDGDGLTDADELYEFGTDPNLVDTDSDGLTDGESVVPVASYPAGVDSDDDGFVDGEMMFGTDPGNADTDGDGILDGAEASAGTDPGDASPVVSITAPSSGSIFANGESITFTGSAIDEEDGDISSTIAWSSDIDGALGTGTSISVTLSMNSHTVTAAATDSKNAETSTSIAVTVTSIPGDINQDGLVDVADLLLMQRALIDQITLNATQTLQADLYPDGGDGAVDAADLMVLEGLLMTP
jgi:hypothetical protein